MVSDPTETLKKKRVIIFLPTLFIMQGRLSITDLFYKHKMLYHLQQTQKIKIFLSSTHISNQQFIDTIL